MFCRGNDGDDDHDDFANEVCWLVWIPQERVRPVVEDG